MKRTITIIDTKGKRYKTEYNTRDLYLMEVRKHCKAATFKPKKGKGSFTRIKKCCEEFY